MIIKNRKSIWAYSLFVGLVFLVSCTGSKKTDSAKKDSAKNQAEIKFDRTFNDYALFISGIPAKTGSVLGNTDSNAAFKEHNDAFGKRWDEMEKNRLSLMRKWAGEEIHNRVNKNLNTFYPFSGPDFLHVYQIFPHSKKYMFLANEPVGDVPDLKSMNEKDRAEYLKSIAASLGDIFKRSYFITGRMMSQIPRVKGVIPVFMVFMARNNCEIINIEKIQLNKDAKTATRAGAATNGLLEGVRFTFRPAGNKTDVRTLEYFCCDVSDDGLTKTPELLSYITAYGKSNTFVKAASYLMHYGTFSKIREKTKEISAGILEDDTGIPLRYLEGFKPVLFGKYVKPIEDFSGVYQADLDKLYNDKSAEVRPLPFSLGYHWKNKDQNYMLFTK
jgi:hypothetical protein